MKKILLLGPSLEGFSGGIQTHARNFLNVFQSHEDVAITYFPITLGLYNNESWPKKIQRNVLLYVPFIRQALKHDIVHLNSSFDNRCILRDTAFAFMAKVFLRKKVIYQFHGGRAHRVGVLNNRIFFSMIKFVFSRIDLFLILSGV